MFQSVLHVLVHQIGLQFLGLYLLIPFGSSIQPFEVGTKGGDGIWVCLQANRSQNEDHEKYNNNNKNVIQKSVESTEAFKLYSNAKIC